MFQKYIIAYIFSRVPHAINDRTNKFQGRVKLTLAGEKLNFDLKIDNSQIEFRPAGNHPEALKRWKNEMKRYVEEKTWNGQEGNVSTIHGFNQWLCMVGDLRIGYLIAFAAFGYRYAFDKRLDIVRKQLDNPNDHIINFFWSFTGWKPSDKLVLAIANEPVELVYISVGHSSIILPWLDGPLDLYAELLRRYSCGEQINFQGKQIFWPDQLRLDLDFITDLPKPKMT